MHAVAMMDLLAADRKAFHPEAKRRQQGLVFSAWFCLRWRDICNVPGWFGAGRPRECRYPRGLIAE